MMRDIEILDVVALTTDRLDAGLSRGQVATVVEVLEPGVFEVEFSDDQGETYALLAIGGGDLLRLSFEPETAAETWRLEDLLIGMTPEAMGEASDWGDDRGREAVTV